MFVEPYPPHTDALLATIRAIYRLVVANAHDYGQDTSIVHAIVLERLAKMAALYRDHNLLNASHLQVIRCFASAAPARPSINSVSSFTASYRRRFGRARTRASPTSGIGARGRLHGDRIAGRRR